MSRRNDLTRWADELTIRGGVLTVREMAPWAQALATSARHGHLTRIFPGVYVAPGTEHDPMVRMRAAMEHFPNGVVGQHAAAAISYWPECRINKIAIAGVRHRVPRAGFTFSERRITPDWITSVDQIRITAPEFTAIDLAPATDGESIDVLLRTRSGTIEGMQQALQHLIGTPGQQARRQLLLDSRAGAWSAAERLAHKILRAARIAGWQANYRIVLRGKGGRADVVLYLDIAFPGHKVVIEIDGWEHHQSRAAFEADRVRQNLLVLAGWTVLRFTWRSLQDDPSLVVREVRRALAQSNTSTKVTARSQFPVA